MAVQQSITVALNILGDGSSTSFLYSFSKLFGLISDSGETFINPGTLPTSAAVVSVPQGFPMTTASIDGFGNLVLVFASAPSGPNSSPPVTQGANVIIQLFFNSGTLQGTTQAWTSATALNTTWTLPLTSSNSVEVGFVVTGSITGGTILFEVSQDGANWFPIQGAISNGYTALTGWTNGVGSLPIQFDVAGFSYLRLRLNPILTGTGTVTFIMEGSNVSVEPVPVIGQANGANLHMTLDDGAGGNPVSTVIKGTQGARAITTQDIKDSGRTYVTFTATAAAGVIAETLLSMAQNKQGVNTAGVTSYTITSGKTLRITSIAVSVRSAAAAIAFARVALRHNTAGATTSASPIAYLVPEVNTLNATLGSGGDIAIDIPDGLEFYGNGTQSIGISHLDQATTNILNVTISGYEY
jgi:hypothetical protein